MEHVVLFPTGWGAGFGTIVGLIRPHDYILMDELAHACLQQGAAAATPNVLRYRHNQPETLRSQLQEIRGRDAKAGILVITEGLFSMDSDVPDIRAFQTACDDYEATLFVDIAHDFGAMGPGGAGSLGRQNLLGEVDLVMGSFSKTFASNGGFLATNSESVKQFIKSFGGPHIFSNALSPVQATVVSEALRIVRSAEGDRLRDQLMQAVNGLRQGFTERGIEVIGEGSAIVPAMVGTEAAGRIAARLLYDNDVFANLVEFPAVAVGASRFRLQVMATHSSEQVSKAAEIVSWAIKEGRRLTG